MWVVHVICSGPECSEELEIVAETVDELDHLSCECGYGFTVLSVAEADLVETRVAEVVQFGIRRARDDSQRKAA